MSSLNGSGTHILRGVRDHWFSDFLLGNENPTTPLDIFAWKQIKRGCSWKAEALNDMVPVPSTTSYSTMWFKLRARKTRYQGRESSESLMMKYRRSLGVG
ncbi:hypothetical protein F5Y06DRAFT_270656 [Hypoxylon sp. FL0890]|nr:hypothetical protein F5Y06DRAFT_270656 [Hypoxylon sp. FL0890]